jgi:hypothetical protein
MNNRLSSARYGIGLWVLFALVPVIFSAVALDSVGQSFVVLSPGPVVGGFDVDSYLTDPAGWPAHGSSYPDGWAVMYRGSQAPPGFDRPFVIRAGGQAEKAGVIHPRFLLAMEEMLPNRTVAMLAQRAAPNPDACSPGQPNPMPLYRNGWMFLHDGWISVTEMNRDLWQLDLDPGWDSFKRMMPRDFNGNFQTDRGNAGEIYFLTLLFELGRADDDMLLAATRTLHRLSSLPGANDSQFNGIIQGSDCTWVIRYAPAAEENYRIHYTHTTTGEYCITDSIPSGSGDWQEVPNYHLACFSVDSPVLFYPIEFSSVENQPPVTALQLKISPTPAVGQIGIRFTLPSAGDGYLELLDIEGRRLMGQPATGRDGAVILTPPAGCGSGLYWVRLIQGGRETRRRVILLR